MQEGEPTQAEEYTKRCQTLAHGIIAQLEVLEKLMIEQGDGVRAMDVNEAIGYVKASIDEAK
jgi:hypothetical protein